MRRCAAKVQLPSECRISHSSQSTYFDAVALGAVGPEEAGALGIGAASDGQGQPEDAVESAIVR